MSYRDETEALRAKVASLEEENRTLNERARWQADLLTEASEVSNEKQKLINEAKDALRQKERVYKFETAAELARLIFFRGAIIVALVAVCYGVYASCGGHVVTRGYVVNRIHNRPYITSSQPMVAHPETWVIVVADAEGSRTISLPYETWNRTPLGSWWCEDNCQPGPWSVEER